MPDLVESESSWSAKQRFADSSLSEKSDKHWQEWLSQVHLDYIEDYMDFETAKDQAVLDQFLKEK